ncbi:uncharacterized protein CANTADRAFT_49007 [Suhomyces tanzawaensis NRRL Y-17324]|uniref:Uncharacterized protein n=1 Tax=Suhomyces tanzawaensis NRRL Y-17324 TaxID=984487 RepID=A0A1E4SLM8_9ASCO|nr:uncharacterized protein CANTADRAFT_49007 [Suhomyces tanzawaensis NRRL Y-17324]ODV80414.1 hypothetical protein CANTADRAFT_49007 [Suhomyces tanzawaensis NRRL Y-17324]
MDDPRYIKEKEEDLLTEESGDELNDLVKEFEAKYNEIQKRKKARHDNEPEAIKKAPARTRSVQLQKGDMEILKEALTSKESVPKPKEAVTGVASSFVKKLYQTNYNETAQKYQRIDYSKRKFAFEGIEDFQRGDIACDELDTISGQYLRKRYIDRPALKSLIHQTDPELKFLKIDKLFAKVNKGNNYQEPMYNNWCFAGIVLKKSDPKNTKDNRKFMKLSVGDFQRSVELMLFNEAFNQYWKLKVGDIIIILNPMINKYQFDFGEGNSKSGFTLKLDDHGLNSILELGATRDFGICSYVSRKDDKRCQEVINKTKTELCEFHLELKFKSGLNKRMELNGSVHMKSPKRGKLSVYLGESGTGFMKYEKSYNEDTRVYLRASELFKNPDKYHDPKMLQNNAEKRRKIMDARANKALEDKLSKLSNHTTFKTLNLIKDDKVEQNDPNKLMEIKSRGFPNSMLNKIGFDPTFNHKLEEQSPTKKKEKLERVKELYELSSQKAKDRTLTLSEQDKKLRHDKWQLNSKNLKQYQQKVNLLDINGGMKQPSLKETIWRSPQSRKNKVVLSDEDFSESDSDIDIDFDTEEMKQAYQNRINGSK